MPRHTMLLNGKWKHAMGSFVRLKISTQLLFLLFFSRFVLVTSGGCNRNGDTSRLVKSIKCRLREWRGVTMHKITHSIIEYVGKEEKNSILFFSLDRFVNECIEKSSVAYEGYFIFVCPSALQID